jgi:hypothetical protein
MTANPPAIDENDDRQRSSFASRRQTLTYFEGASLRRLHRPSVAKGRSSMSSLGQASTGHELTTIMDAAYGS